MNKVVVALTVMLLFSVNSYAQDMSCEELLTFVKEKGYSKGTLDSYELHSSWLYRVTAYEYDYKIYVAAEIKTDKYGYSTKTYIFCAIPDSNWRNFQYGGYSDSQSYGERFHKYIMDYQCNCN